MIRHVAALMTVLVLGGPVDALGAQREASTAEEVAALKAMAAAIPLGSRVKINTREGRRLTATLMSVQNETIVVKRETRVPEPAITVRFDELARLERAERGGGLNAAKILGIGLAAGAGAVLSLFAILVALD